MIRAMAVKDGDSTINMPRAVWREWVRTRNSLGVSNGRLAEVLLDRWMHSTPEEQGKALLHQTPERKRRAKSIA
jgi:hypothetical protein